MRDHKAQDLIVIGAGPGGYVAAIRAAQLGMTVTLIEKNEVGGTCLNVGCIPTKAFYANAGVINTVRNSTAHGIISGGLELDMAAVIKNKKKIVKQLTTGVRSLLKANQVQVVKGTAKLLAADTVEVSGVDGMTELHKAKHILIATGSKPAPLPASGAELDVVIDSTAALALDEIPKHLLIVGAGVIGIEFAGIYRAFGSEVTVVEYMPDILPNMDRELAGKLKKEMEGQGIDFHLAAKVASVKEKDGGAVATVETKDGQKEIVCDIVLSATGRLPNVTALNLSGVGVDSDSKGFVVVDENYETSVPGVYAIGDIIPGPMLAHVASAEGIAAVEGMCGQEAFVDLKLVPQSVFSFPEYSSIGLSEEEAQASDTDYVVSQSYFRGNGKALTMHEGSGQIKILASPDLKTILGVHVLGPHANDLIAEAAVAMYSLLTIEEYASVMRGHPTLSEALAEAVDNLMGCAIHIPPKRK